MCSLVLPRASYWELRVGFYDREFTGIFNHESLTAVLWCGQYSAAMVWAWEERAEHTTRGWQTNSAYHSSSVLVQTRKGVTSRIVYVLYRRLRAAVCSASQILIYTCRVPGSQIYWHVQSSIVNCHIVTWRSLKNCQHLQHRYDGLYKSRTRKVLTASLFLYFSWSGKGWVRGSLICPRGVVCAVMCVPRARYWDLPVGFIIESRTYWYL